MIHAKVRCDEDEPEFIVSCGAQQLSLAAVTYSGQALTKASPTRDDRVLYDLPMQRLFTFCGRRVKTGFNFGRAAFSLRTNRPMTLRLEGRFTRCQRSHMLPIKPCGSQVLSIGKI